MGARKGAIPHFMPLTILKLFYFTNILFITFAVIVTVTGTSMQRSWFMLLFQLQFGEKCNFLTVDGSINLRFDVSVTVTALGPLESDFFYCKKLHTCLLYTSPSPRDGLLSRMPSSA